MTITIDQSSHTCKVRRIERTLHITCENCDHHRIFDIDTTTIKTITPGDTTATHSWTYQAPALSIEAFQPN